MAGARKHWVWFLWAKCSSVFQRVRSLEIEAFPVLFESLDGVEIRHSDLLVVDLAAIEIWLFLVFVELVPPFSWGFKAKLKGTTTLGGPLKKGTPIFGSNKTTL